MKLYLSSYRFGTATETLLALLGNGRRAAIIGNALDMIPADDQVRYRTNIYDPITELADLGITADMLDLRDYFDTHEALPETLSRYDLVWVLGGNSFLLRRAMARSGFDQTIGTALADGLVYGGFSAGAVVATPTLRGIELMDDPHQLAPGYTSDIIWDGLSLVDFSIVPHFRSNHAEAALAEAAVAHMLVNGQTHRSLRDGQVILRNGSHVEIIGEPL
ncbi:Type 1 glutamine amidotransferase-like domain-containing protein [uncultured Devosia sp.]|uniref:Type 1 glutamine amidotransferase-like domain-containing protein n=1 Tax=uncultured Devosia sp. TaxID=211434 RepID=UPI0035CB5C0F